MTNLCPAARPGNQPALAQVDHRQFCRLGAGGPACGLAMRDPAACQAAPQFGSSWREVQFLKILVA